MTQTRAADPAADRALVQLMSRVLPVWMRHLASSREQSEAAVAQMLTAFGELVPLMAPAQRDLRPEPGLTEPIERMYQGFQYQDRVSQMVALLQQDMDRLLQALALGDTTLNAEQWLARLESGYVMAEQHHSHHGKSANDPDETTFF